MTRKAIITDSNYRVVSISWDDAEIRIKKNTSNNNRQINICDLVDAILLSFKENGFVVNDLRDCQQGFKTSSRLSRYYSSQNRKRRDGRL